MQHAEKESLCQKLLLPLPPLQAQARRGEERRRSRYASSQKESHQTTAIAAAAVPPVPPTPIMTSSTPAPQLPLRTGVPQPQHPAG